MKNCVILGPSKVGNITIFGKIKDINAYIEDAANFLAANFEEVLIIPDNTLALEIAKTFKKNNARGKVIGYAPGKSMGAGKINQYFKYCDEIIDSGGGWFNLNASLTKNSDYVFAFGLSAGVLIEICSIKYNQIYLNLNTHIFIDKRSISAKLPEEAEADLKNLFYFDDFKALEKIIKK